MIVGHSAVAKQIYIDQCRIFADRQMFLNIATMKNCFLRLSYDEIAKCSVHSNIFVKPKQYVSCLLVLWCFSPWFCKFSRLVCSVKPVFHQANLFARREAKTRIRQRDWLKLAGEKIRREQVGSVNVPTFLSVRANKFA